jgi:hypothetical protein
MLHRLSIVIAATAALLIVAPMEASADIAPGTHQIVNRQDTLCLDVLNAYTYNGADVGVWHCVNASNQRWTKTQDKSGLWLLSVEHTGKCLSVQWKGNGYGSKIVQDDCSAAEHWYILDVGEGWDYIYAYHETSPNYSEAMCLDKSNWSVVAWRCNGNRWQEWQSMG